MNRDILLGLSLLPMLCDAPVFAQKTDDKSKEAKPDFTGTWAWKLSDSDKGFDRLTTIQNENEITIWDKETFPGQPLIEMESTHFTDGRGERNQLPDGKISESTTNWKGNKLIIGFYQTDSGSGKK